MKIALVTTTINVPRALAVYREIDANVFFVVIGDRKTDDIAVADFLFDVPNHVYYGADWQTKLGYKCSELLGWSRIQRRNIGILEALKTDADIIWLWDDDNLCLNDEHFDHMRSQFDRDFAGVAVETDGWFDPGSLLTPAVRHRGLPLGHKAQTSEFHPASRGRVGVSVGLWIGDGDVNACDRIANPPEIHSATELARAGVVVAPNTKTVFNAQNVAFRRELAPAMFQIPHIGRADDIFASLIAQRVMSDTDLWTRIGGPFTACWQNRSKASLLADLRDEMFLYEHVEEFADYLGNNPMQGRSQIDYLRWLYSDLAACAWWPKKASEAGLAWLDDIEKVM